MAGLFLSADLSASSADARLLGTICRAAVSLASGACDAQRPGEHAASRSFVKSARNDYAVGDSRAGNRAGRGSCRAGQCACGGPAADPYSRYRSGPWVGPGAAIWKMRCWILCGGSPSEPAASAPECALGHPFWIFERLNHVAANLQSVPLRAGKVSCVCSANGQ
jgi:hypothetical protein